MMFITVTVTEHGGIGTKQIGQVGVRNWCALDHDKAGEHACKYEVTSGGERLGDVYHSQGRGAFALMAKASELAARKRMI